MSKLTRVYQKQFAANAGASDVGIFGSLAAADPQYSKDPETIQSLNAFMTGWAAETIANNRPALEDFNAVDFLAFYQICYLLQTGVPEWDTDTVYYEGSVVNDGTGVLYKSLTDANQGNEVTDTENWAPVVAPVVPAFENALLHVRDEKAANTDGGTFSQDAWRTRDITVVKTNEITGASLASNQITLPAGTYYVEGWANGWGCGFHKTRLYDTTGSADLIIGESAYCGFPGGDFAGETSSKLAGRFTLAEESVLELQHYCDQTRAGDGFGYACNMDSKVEVYSELKIWKVA